MGDLIEKRRLNLRRVMILASLTLGFGLFTWVGVIWLYTALMKPMTADFPMPLGEDPTADYCFVRVEDGRVKFRRQHAFVSRIGAGTGVVSAGKIDATGSNAMVVKDVVQEVIPDVPQHGTAPSASGPSPTGATELRLTLAPDPAPDWLAWRWESRDLAPQVGLNGATFAMRVSTYAFPLWWLMVLGLLIAAPAFWLGRRSHRWRMTGHCPGCGYDLRESPDRCPECGRPASIAHPAG